MQGADGNIAVWVDGACKRFGRRIAVQRVDLRLPEGSICGLVGANGAGKTTTLKMLMGILRPTAGRFSVLGLDPQKQAIALRQRIGYVPENHHIYPWMRVAQVLRFASRIYRDWDHSEALRLLSTLDVPAAQQVKSLSRGQLAKLALIVGLAHRPELLILDEPTSGLDPIARRDFLAALAELRQRRHCTILFSTHILPDVERIADEAVILHAGRVVAHDSLEGLRRRYVKASLLFPAPPPHDRPLPEALRVEKAMREWVAIFPAMPEERIRAIAADTGATDCMVRPASLDDVYLELAATIGDRADIPPGGAIA